MGFFDDLGKKVTDVSQRAVQKTQEMSEISRINSSIAQNENVINGIYYQIGKLYVDIHGNDAEEPFADMVKTAIELAQQNDAYREKIQDVRGLQRCPKCGAEVSKEFAFCNFCGAPMPIKAINKAAADAVQCPRCGTAVEKGTRFCTYCGQEMPSPETQMPSYAAEMPSAETQMPESAAEMSSFDAQVSSRDAQIPPTDAQSSPVDAAENKERRCPQCGAVIYDDAAFCAACGSKLS